MSSPGVKPGTYALPLGRETKNYVVTDKGEFFELLDGGESVRIDAEQATSLIPFLKQGVYTDSVVTSDDLAKIGAAPNVKAQYTPPKDEPAPDIQSRILDASKKVFGEKKAVEDTEDLGRKAGGLAGAMARKQLGG